MGVTLFALGGKPNDPQLSAFAPAVLWVGVLLSALLLTLLIFALATLASAQTVDPDLYSGMKWRLVGPYRGGRSLAVAGSVQRPKEYFFGATGGGVWKTVDGGTSWAPVSDGFFTTATVGAIAMHGVRQADVVGYSMGNRVVSALCELAIVCASERSVSRPLTGSSKSRTSGSPSSAAAMPRRSTASAGCMRMAAVWCGMIRRLRMSSRWRRVRGMRRRAARSTWRRGPNRRCRTAWRPSA